MLISFCCKKVKGLVSMVIPLSEVSLVEKVDNSTKGILPDTILITTRNKVGYSDDMMRIKSIANRWIGLKCYIMHLLIINQVNYLFANLIDRDLVLERISDLLCSLPEFCHSPSQILSTSLSFTTYDPKRLSISESCDMKRSFLPISGTSEETKFIPALRSLFPSLDQNLLVKDQVKRQLWDLHFEEYGRQLFWAVDSIDYYYCYWSCWSCCRHCGCCCCCCCVVLIVINIVIIIS